MLTSDEDIDLAWQVAQRAGCPIEQALRAVQDYREGRPAAYRRLTGERTPLALTAAPRHVRAVWPSYMIAFLVIVMLVAAGAIRSWGLG